MTARTLGAGLLAAALLGLTACGGNGSEGPREELDLADQARAEAIALTVIDFPAGWQGSGYLVGDDDDYGRCDVALSRLTATGIESRSFVLESGTVARSTATVFSLASDAAVAFGQLARPDVVRCLVGADAEKDPVTVVRRLSLPRFGHASAAFEVVFDIPPTGVPDAAPTTYANFVFIRRGRGLSFLFLLEDGSPFDATLRAHLAGKVAERMRLAFA